MRGPTSFGKFAVRNTEEYGRHYEAATPDFVARISYHEFRVDHLAAYGKKKFDRGWYLSIYDTSIPSRCVYQTDGTTKRAVEKLANDWLEGLT